MTETINALRSLEKTQDAGLSRALYKAYDCPNFFWRSGSQRDGVRVSIGADKVTWESKSPEPTCAKTEFIPMDCNDAGCTAGECTGLACNLPVHSCERRRGMESIRFDFTRAKILIGGQDPDGLDLAGAAGR